MTGEFVPAADASLWTVTTGVGPLLARCHSGSGIRDGLGSLVEGRCTVHRCDQRACGRSSGAGPFTLARFVEALRSAGRTGGAIAGSWRARLAELPEPRERTRELHDEFCALAWAADLVGRGTAIATARRTLRPGTRVNFALNRSLTAGARRVLAGGAFRDAVAALARCAGQFGPPAVSLPLRAPRAAP